jgi:hypothetical protein
MPCEYPPNRYLPFPTRLAILTIPYPTMNSMHRHPMSGHPAYHLHPVNSSWANPMKYRRELKTRRAWSFRR